MNEKFVKLLRELNLSTTQIKVYLSVLKSGLSSVYEISKDIKVNRSQIYLDTNILTEMGLLEIGSKRVKKYLAIDPKNISKIIKSKKNKLDELENILDEVSGIYEGKKKDKFDDYDLKIFEGRSEIRDAFLFELESSKGKEVVSLVGDIEEQYDIISETFWDKWNKDHILNGGTGRMIIDNKLNSFEYVKNKKDSLVTRGLPNFKLKINVDAWEDHSLIVAFNKNPKAVLIKNKLVADAFRQIFNKLWDSAS